MCVFTVSLNEACGKASNVCFQKAVVHVALDFGLVIYVKGLMVFIQLCLPQRKVEFGLMILQGLKLYLDYGGTQGYKKGSRSGSLEHANSAAWASAYSGVAAGAALVAGLGLLTYLKRT